MKPLLLVAIVTVTFLTIQGAFFGTAFFPGDVETAEGPKTYKRIFSALAQNSSHPFLKNDSRSVKRVNLTTVIKAASKSPSLTECDSWFEPSFEDNLNVIKNYHRGNSHHYLQKLGDNMTSPQKMLTSFPVIATAANSGFFGVTQGLLKTIHEVLIPKYGEIKIVYYNMGLTEQQSIQLKKYCKCEVRTFPFDEFPPHVQRLKTYAWKPIIIKKLLMEYGWVWWMDSSVRFVTSDLDRALEYSKKNSILFFTYGVVLSVAQHTDQQTMQYLKEDPCKFRTFGEVEATFVLFHYDHVTRILIDAWTACAVEENCISPPGTANKLGCNVRNKNDGRCHRFDQAVLSIMLRRLYHDQNDYPLVEVPFHIHDIRRGNSVNYFPK